MLKVFLKKLLYWQSSSLNMKVLFPFLDFNVIKTAMGLPPELKLKDQHKKYVLRLIAKDFSLPEKIVWRPKKAAQYGSRIDKIISSLAKQQGLSKKEFIKSL